MNNSFACGRNQDRFLEGGWSARLAQELDPRLADVWSCLFAVGVEGSELLEQIGWFIRMAYLQGYEDGLTEPSRGALLVSLGVAVPNRSGSARRGGRR